jgi:hypothetical protein
MLSKVSYHYPHICLPFWVRLSTINSYQIFFAFRLWKPESISSIVAFPTIANRMSATIGTSLVMTKVEVFEISEKKVKLQGQRSEGQDHNIKWNVLPEGVHI